MSKLAVAIFLLAATLPALAVESGRSQVESFMSKYATVSEGDPWLERNPSLKLLTNWPQFSKKFAPPRGGKPVDQIVLDLGGQVGSKWAVVKTSSKETSVMAVRSEYFDSPPDDPSTVVGALLVFETRFNAGEGWRIVPKFSDSGKYAHPRHSEWISWRDYVALGYAKQVNDTYGSGSSQKTSVASRRSTVTADSYTVVREGQASQGVEYTLSCSNGRSATVVKESKPVFPAAPFLGCPGSNTFDQCARRACGF